MDPPVDLPADLATALVGASNESWAEIVELARSLEPDDWGRPTPCVGWSVKDVLAHLGHVEGFLVHQFDQPEPLADFKGEGSPLDQATGAGVAARRAWSPAQVFDEIQRAAEATRLLLSQPDLAWHETALTPVGPAPRHVAVEMRVNDVYLHLLDVRTAIGRPIDVPAVPGAKKVAIGRAVRLSPWAWAKKVGAVDSQRLRLSLTGAVGVDHDIVMREGKAVVEPRQGTPTATVAGSALAYLLAVSGRHALVPAGGGLVARGALAQDLLEKFRLVG